MNVSVIIATYGGLEWRLLALERALPSVEAMDPPPVEVRLVHGESLHEARNAGALAARGEWLCFLDADDELEAGYLRAMELSEAGVRGAAALLVPAVRYLDDRGRPVTEPEIPNAVPARSLIEVNRAVIGTLIPRSLFLDEGGFAGEPIYEDWALWLRCVRAGAQLVHVPDAVYRAWRRRGSRNRWSRDVAAAEYWRIRGLHEGSCAELMP